MNFQSIQYQMFVTGTSYLKYSMKFEFFRLLSFKIANWQSDSISIEKLAYWGYWFDVHSSLIRCIGCNKFFGSGC